MKVLPHNVDAERALIGSCMMNPDIIPKVQQMISPSDCYRESHQILLESIFSLKQKAGDLVVLSDDLRRRGLLEKVGGADYIGQIMEDISTSAAWEHHARIIQEHSTRRSLIEVCHTAIDKAHNPTDDIEDTLSELKNAVRINRSDGGYTDPAQLVQSVFKEIEERSEGHNPYVGIKTGLDNIDCETRGLEPKSTTYLIARPSMGKSSLALNIADNVAEQGGTVLYFSLESNDRALTRRRLSRESGVYLTRLREGNLTGEQFDALVKANSSVSARPVIILDKPRYKTIEHMTAFCESMAMDRDISLIVVDHIQRMTTKKRLQNRHLELSWISEQLSTLANDLDTCLLILCQLNREIEKRPLNRQYPQLSDMKESGDLEANADQVWGLWRKDRESPDARLECLKGRDTGTWTTWLGFDRFTQKFTDGKEPVTSAVNSQEGGDEL